ncbi:hypothetical protein [Chondromyces crocatus]|uniref:hypothetical protein n=1 Tax=Chondromyces crocatus TaxID=52 RepID=UPI0012E275F7|nr:hypothetical protein [Chondromyces crocatus]
MPLAPPSRRPAPLLLALLLPFALLLGAPRPATAATAYDPLVDLTFQLDPPGGSVCNILPERDRDPAACEGIDVAAIAASTKAQVQVPSYFGIVRTSSFLCIVTVAAQVGVKPRSAEDLDGYVSGFAEGARDMGGPVRSRYELLQINGVDVIRSLIEVDLPPEHPNYGTSRMLTYTFVGQAGLAAVSFAFSPVHSAEVRTLAEAAMATAKTPPFHQEGFGLPRARQMGRLTGRIAAMVLIPAGFLAYMLWQRRKRTRGGPTLPS